MPKIGHYFSKVLNIVTLYTNYSRALTFENVHAIRRHTHMAGKSGVASKGAKKSEKVPITVTLVGKYVGR